jgi:hypothetical protein
VFPGSFLVAVGVISGKPEHLGMKDLVYVPEVVISAIPTRIILVIL